MLEKEKVLHVANLAKLDLTEDEIKLYQQQLYTLVEEIDKINKVEINNEEIMISPSLKTNCLSNDESKEMLSVSDILKNAPTTEEDYLIVPRVIND